MLKYFLGTKNGLMNAENPAGHLQPKEVDWVEKGPTGKLDLVVTLDFRMSSTRVCILTSCCQRPHGMKKMT